MDSIPAAAFRLSGGVGAETWAGLFGTVCPEFIARDGQERADGSRQGGKRRVVRPAAQRGHGPAYPDGARPRATVADKVMKSGGQRRLRWHRPKARRPAAGSRAEGVSRAERGNDGSPKGARLTQRGSMRSTTARPAMTAWPGMPQSAIFKPVCGQCRARPCRTEAPMDLYAEMAGRLMAVIAESTVKCQQERSSSRPSCRGIQARLWQFKIEVACRCTASSFRQARASDNHGCC